MKRAELKEIAPYLPYGLKGMYVLSEVISLVPGQGDEIREKYLTPDSLAFFLSYCKPVLRPMTDLIKGDNMIFEVFTANEFAHPVSCGYEHKYYYACFGLDTEIFKEKLSSDPDSMRVYEFNKLLKNHFDVFDLISKGLAIDINTLNDEERRNT